MQAEGRARQSAGPHGSQLRVGIIIIIIFNSHIFPGFRAQHCNDATLLAGR